MPDEIWEELEDLWDYVTGIHEREPLSSKPPVNVFECEDHYLIQVALAGVHMKDIKIVFKDGTLIVQGKREDTIGNQQGKYHSLEIYFGPFERRIPIRGAISEDKIETSYEDGLLQLKIPKIKENMSNKSEE